MNERILVVDDDPNMCELLEARLSSRGFSVTLATSAVEALEILGSSESDVVVTDMNMRKMSGLELCRRIAMNHSDVPVIVITAFGSFETAAKAIHAGAHDFITKPLKIEELRLAIERAVQHRLLRQEVKRLRRVVENVWGFGELLGESPAMRSVYELLERLVECDAPVLITGERGTGKQLVARSLHFRGRRAAGPFVAVDCSAMPEALLESELFGCGRGSFTRARAVHEGLFRRANGGTIFLDQVGCVPASLQPRLVRALRERVVRPAGATLEMPLDVRVVAATNRDLELAVEEGRFREDLYLLLNVAHVEMPALRAMGRDILLLAQHFIQRYSAELNKPVKGISSQAAERLLTYPWPGNARELRNCIERAVALSPYDQITFDDLPEKIRGYTGAPIVIVGDDPADVVPLDQVERQYIFHVLGLTNGNKARAARLLGMDRKTLHRKLDQEAATGGDFIGD